MHTFCICNAADSLIASSSHTKCTSECLYDWIHHCLCFAYADHISVTIFTIQNTEIAEQIADKK